MPLAWALPLLLFLAQLSNGWASLDSQHLVSSLTTGTGLNKGLGGRKGLRRSAVGNTAAEATAHGDIPASRVSQASADPTPGSSYNATQASGYQNRRLLADGASQPSMCAHALVTAYAEVNFKGPMVSLSCSSSDLSLLLCFPIASLAVQPGVTVALYSYVGFTGSKLVISSSEPDLFANYHRKYAFAGSLAVCSAAVEDPINDCPDTASASLRICPEENPLGPRGDVNTLTAAHSSGEHFRSSTDGQFVLKYMRPRQAFWQTSGPEACFYKTYVREAQMGCLPAGDQAFQDLATEFIPHYQGVVHNFVYGSGEWVVLQNVAHGIPHASILELDPGFGKCTRCGVDIRGYRSYLAAKGDYKVVTHDEINKKHAGASNKRKLIMHEIGEFLFEGGASSSVVRELLLPKMERLHQLLAANRLISFIDVSLLIVHGAEGEVKVAGDKNVVTKAFSTKGSAGRVYLVDFGGVMHADMSKAMSILPPIFRIRPPGLLAESSPAALSNEKHTQGAAGFTCGVLEISLHMSGFANYGKMKIDTCLAPCLRCR